MSRQQQIEAAVVLFAAILYLTGSFWKAILVSMVVLVSCVLGFGLRGSLPIAIVSIAVVLGALRALINGCSCGRTPDEHSPFGSLAKSITSSARASPVAGPSRPTAFAVFRLRTASF